MPALVWANQERVSLMVRGWVSLQHLKAGMREVYCNFLHSWHISAASRRDISQVHNRMTVGVRAWMFKRKVFTQDSVGGKWPLCHCRKNLETMKHLQITIWFSVLHIRLCDSLTVYGLKRFRGEIWKLFLVIPRNQGEGSGRKKQQVCVMAHNLCLQQPVSVAKMVPRHGMSPAFPVWAVSWTAVSCALCWRTGLGGAAGESGFGRSFAKLLNF